MRILHLSSLYPPHIVGGAERSVEHLAEELVAMGHDVGAACIAREPSPRRSETASRFIAWPAITISGSRTGRRITASSAPGRR